jgi:hypothetical protein
MADIRKQPRRRAGATLALAAATGGLLAAAIAGSPAARADNPYTDIVNDVQGSITTAEAEYAAAATDFSTASGTNAGLAEEFAAFDNTFVSPPDYVLLGLVAAGTGTDYSTSGGDFFDSPSNYPLTAAGETSEAAFAASQASTFYTDAATALSGGNYFSATDFFLVAGYDDLIAGQNEILAALFSAGI